MASELEQRLSAASTFLLQSPPGEVNDVFADVRTIVGDDAALESGILPALEQYNTEQFIVVDLEGSKVLITEASKLKGDGKQRQVDPKGQRSFAFDHMKVAASDPQPLDVDAETESIRSSIEKVLSTHVSNHYSEGASAVYALEDANYPEPEPEPVAAAPVEEAKPEPEVESAPVAQEAATEETSVAGEEEVKAEDGEAEKPAAEEDEAAEEKPVEAGAEEKPTPMETTPAPAPAPAPPTPPAPRPSRVFGLYFVGTKYNPSNYWTGKWRSVYTADFAKGMLEGKALVNVHYYEQGNVQLSTTLRSTFPLPSSTPTPESLIALLKSSEASFASQLSDAYSGLSDEQFRGLRRALPRTRTKVDWAKIVNYRLSKELGGGQAGEA